MRLFSSFWGGGFDAIAPLINTASGLHRLDLLPAVQHDLYAACDYQKVRQLGLGWTREDVRWHICEPEPGRFSFDHLEPILEAAQRSGIQIIWSWMQYGCPTFRNPLHPDFTKHFTTLGEAHLRWLQRHNISKAMIAPINEISYYTWRAGLAPDQAWYPFSAGQDVLLKQRLIEAHCASYTMIKTCDRQAQVLAIDPFYYVVGNAVDQQSMCEARGWCQAALDALDQLQGYADIMGINYYPEGQVERVWDRRMQKYINKTMSRNDSRRLPLNRILQFLHQRYPGKQFIVAETSQRAHHILPWLHKITAEIVQALYTGVPLRGICWHPVLDVFDWGKVSSERNTFDTLPLAHAGLISLRRRNDGCLQRFQHQEILRAVQASESVIQSTLLEIEQERFMGAAAS